MIGTIKIGPIDYAVKQIADLHDHDVEGKRVALNGHILSDKCEVRIETALPLCRARVTVWHEILHGILFNAEVSDHDEKLIGILAHGIVDVLRDNPALVRLTVEDPA